MVSFFQFKLYSFQSPFSILTTWSVLLSGIKYSKGLTLLICPSLDMKPIV